MDPVVHFEIPASDKSRMRKFYETVFGWKTEQLGKDMMEYVLVTTTEVGEDRMVKKPGTINGGFYQRTDDPISQHPSVTIQVKNVAESVEKAQKAGGKLSGKIEEIPNVGKFASIIDTEGNRISLMQSTHPVL